MSKKVFRIHNQGALTNDWFSSTEINDALISSINTDGGNGKKLPTSIPSPFARIDLVRTAFDVVGGSGQLDGIEIHGNAMASDNHKLISDALDIGQILFNYNKFKDNLSLVAWDKRISLDKLLNGNEKQRHLGKTLDLFLKQDSVQYNFELLDKLYIIKYNHEIIGGTSPRTLFFAAPDAKAIDIKFGNDIMLDDGLHPLYKRDKEYIKYLYAMSKSPDFNNFFPEFNKYLIATFRKIALIDQQFYNELMTLNTGTHLSSLKNVTFNGNAGHPLEVISGFALKQYVLDPKLIENNSDLVIKTVKIKEGLKPLVLPLKPLIHKYIYTFDTWNPETIVLPSDKRPLNERTLPEQGDLYPYLTMNDFLTDTIVKLPYDIDKIRFFTLGENKYLLPLTDRFFDYFKVEELVEGNFLEYHARAGDSLEVILNIPIKKGFIQYSKIYYPKKHSDPAKGSIVEKSFAFSIFPFVNIDQVNMNYALGLADVLPEKGINLDVEVINTNLENSHLSKIQKQRSKSPTITTQTLVDQQFDLIKIQVGNVNNYLIPNWPQNSAFGGDNYEFTIDFGTTNSHIEYKIEGQGKEKAFDITTEDAQIAFLMPDDTPKRSDFFRMIEEGETHLMQEVIGKTFGENQLRKAPFRTCLVQNQDVDYQQSTSIFTHVNAGFDYEKTPIRGYLKAFTDLKWAKNETNNDTRLSHYIEELLLLCKNKVLINNGNLSNTKIKWFYPVSMTSNHLNRLRQKWANNYKLVFGENANPTNLINFPESIAPFYYYKAKGGVKAMAKPSVSVDIGGGTTDIMIYADGSPKLISSFRFAGNSIFGDAFNGNINNNGFVQKYYNEFKQILASNSLNSELKILEKLYTDNESSQDIVNFFFSLKNNKNVQDKKLNNLDFSEKLSKNDDFKLVFLLFYGSLVYHIAELMKVKGFESPRNIIFSGTGSKTLQIIDQDTNKYATTKKLFQAIFNNVLGEENSNITIKSDQNPKEVTCKGGFYIDKELEELDHKKLVEVNIGNYNKLNVQSISKVTNDTIKYKDLTNSYLDGVLKNVENFYKLFSKLTVELNFKDIFGVSNNSIKVFEKIKSLDLLDYQLQGLAHLKSDTVDEDPLGETLFFFPIIGKLNELANEVLEE
ncbi:hypothetical protein K8354_04585 [Polaribacter litorisediminis]|uniref:hypothetical protein n=1 Tax=Polaribacter litorisediminis TaxID=1908341 RepID=UPI001CC11436|nr:hypothetical protein [Polaribacter litorisediminis]UAM99107.1 hypothetical protein K8354_04585 [Polaribacter litorisediminis]